MRLNYWHIFFIALLFGINCGYAQNNARNTSNPDSLYPIANNYALEGNYSECRDICYQVLDDYPDYAAYRILIARTLAWEGLSDSARNVLHPLIKYPPPIKEASLLAADIDIWTINYLDALDVLDNALAYYPADSAIQNKKAYVISLMNLPSDSLSVHPRPNLLAPDSNAVGVSYFFQHFTKPYVARRHVMSVHYHKITTFAPLSVSLNLGDYVSVNEQFLNNPSLQLEADMYPQLGEKSYLYLNYGIGQRNFFPLHRLGAEYFTGLNNDFEVSGGIRYMYWDASILFITGSLAKYLGAYWLNFRPYIALVGKNFADSYMFEARRYLKPVNSYVFGQVIMGDSPDQPLILAEKFGNFRSSRYALGVNYRYNQWLTGVTLGYQYEEYLSTQFRNRFDIRLNLLYVF